MFAHISACLKRIRSDENGASLVEYGLLILMVALVVIAAVTAIGTNLNGFFSNAANNLAA